jgi:phage-related protein
MLRLAYGGSIKRIQWLADHAGSFLGQEYYDALDTGYRANFMAKFKRMGDIGSITNKQQCRNEGDGVWCLKASVHRLVFFSYGANVIITHGFRKQSEKMPQGEKDRALRMRAEYLDSRRKSDG